MFFPALLSATLLLAPLLQSLPFDSGPLRNSFVAAVEAVLDDAAAVDIAAADSAYDPKLAQLTAARTYLDSLAEGDREQTIAGATKDLVFYVSACHVQTRNGASTDKCLSQLATARTRIMQQLNRHKAGAAWVEGPPQ